jgi:hypothetical protein
LVDVHIVLVQVVFLDDFESYLKPARDLGMVTIHVQDTNTALKELEKVTGTQVTSHLSGVWFPASVLWFYVERRVSRDLGSWHSLFRV